MPRVVVFSQDIHQIPSGYHKTQSNNALRQRLTGIRRALAVAHTGP
jgi:hypothetical protein